MGYLFFFGGIFQYSNQFIPYFLVFKRLKETQKDSNYKIFRWPVKYKKINLILAKSMNKVKTQKHQNARPLDYNYKITIEKSILRNIPQELQLKYNMRQMVRKTSIVFKFNVFEASLMKWLLKGLDLRVNPELNEKLLQELKKQYAYPLEFEVEYVILANLFLLGFKLKMLTNPNMVHNYIQKQVFRFLPSFQQIFHRWKCPKPLQKISIAEINQIFDHQQEELQPDYNELVNNILALTKEQNKSEFSEENQIVQTRSSRRKKRKISKPLDQQRQLNKKKVEHKEIIIGSPIHFQEKEPDHVLYPKRSQNDIVSILDKEKFESQFDFT